MVFDILDSVILRTVAGIGMLLLVYELLNNKKVFSKSAAAGGVFASFLFTLHFAMFSELGLSFFSVSLLPFSILFLLFFLKSIYSNRFSYSYFILSVFSIAFELSILGNSQIIQGFLIILLTSLFMALFAQKEYRLKSLLFVIGILLVSIAINASWLVMGYMATASISNELQLFQGNSQGDFVNYYLPLVMGYSQALPNTGGFAFSNVLFDIIIAILSIGSLFYVRREREHTLTNPVIIALVTSLILIFAAGASIHKPFGLVFSSLYKYIPYLVVFRYGGASHYEILFLVSVLSGFTISKILESTYNKKKIYTYAVLAGVVILLSYYLYVGSIIQLTIPGIPWSTHILPFINKIPSHTSNIASYINVQKGSFAVATLPTDDDWHLATWYDAPDIYSSLINNPVYTGGFTAYSEFFFPPSEDEYQYIGELIEQHNDTANLSIANGLGIFGIKYIIVQGNTANVTFGPNHPLIAYSFNDIYSNLNRSRAVYFTKRYGNSSIYTNTRAVNLVYATNLYTINSTDSQTIINQVLNRSFNISNFSVYSKNFSAPILWYGSINIFKSNNSDINAVHNFSRPKISFDYASPTKVTVHVHNATTPYYLVFRETYDPHWAAFYSNGTEVNQSDHIAVNGFANAWYMDKTGNYTITLYYTLQTDAWIAWAVSFMALGVTVAIGVYGWKERGKAKVPIR
jgi:hypothetical protein